MIALLRGHFNPSPSNKEVLKAFLDDFEFTYDGVLVVGSDEGVNLVAEEFRLHAEDAADLTWQTAKVTNWDKHLDKVDFAGKSEEILTYLKNDFCSLGEFHKTTIKNA